MRILSRSSPQRVKLPYSGSAWNQEPQENTAPFRRRSAGETPADCHNLPTPTEGDMGASQSVGIPGGGNEGYHVLRVRAVSTRQRVYRLRSLRVRPVVGTGAPS